MAKSRKAAASRGLLDELEGAADAVADIGGQPHFLAWVTQDEADMLVQAGGGRDAAGQQVYGPGGIPAYPPGMGGGIGGDGRGSGNGGVDGGRGDADGSGRDGNDHAGGRDGSDGYGGWGGFGGIGGLGGYGNMDPGVAGVPGGLAGRGFSTSGPGMGPAEKADGGLGTDNDRDTISINKYGKAYKDLDFAQKADATLSNMAYGAQMGRGLTNGLVDGAIGVAAGPAGFLGTLGGLMGYSPTDLAGTPPGAQYAGNHIGDYSNDYGDPQAERGGGDHMRGPGDAIFDALPETIKAPPPAPPAPPPPVQTSTYMAAFTPPNPYLGPDEPTLRQWQQDRRGMDNGRGRGLLGMWG